MIFFGTLGLLQILALPGLILIKALKVRGGLVERMIYCFPFSLLVNYLAVFLLTVAGIYIRPVVLILIALEIFLLVYLFRSSLRQPFSAMIQRFYAAFVSELNPFHQMVPNNKGVYSILSFGIWIVFGCSAVSAVLWGLNVWRLNFGTIFSGQDTLSWNLCRKLGSESNSCQSWRLSSVGSGELVSELCAAGQGCSSAF